MASAALLHVGQLKADIRLAQAMKDFENDLPDAQKKDFDNCSAPDFCDVMRLTAQFDRALSLKGTQRGFGPRLTKFLEAVQQYASTGDILIGGSQYLPACGVWTLVRFSLLAMVQVPLHIDAISKLFMEIGHFAPHYPNISAIFPRSKQLRIYFTEYHVVVVQLCHEIFKSSQNSGWKQLLNSFHDTAKKFRIEMKRWSGAIADEVAIQTALQVNTESQKSAKFRALTRRYLDRRNVEDLAVLKARLSDLCCKYDHKTPWRQIRKQGNTSSFLESPDYICWRDGDSSSTLIYTGILGAGKSVLLANMVDDLFLATYGQKATIAYFFCQYSKPESLETTTILGSLARQVLEGIDDLSLRELALLHPASTTSLSIEELLSIIKLASEKVIFVLDGLDECDAIIKQDVVAHLASIQSSESFRCCFSARLEPDSYSIVHLNQIREAFIVSIPKDNPDIAAFIDSELCLLLETQRLVLSDESILLDIRSGLLNGSGGMFLWVVLQLSVLCCMESDYAIKKALTELPKTLDETYTRILSTMSDHQRSVFEIGLTARRLLTIEELREILSINPGDIEYDPSRLINGILRILASCKGLVIVDEEDSTVGFVHSSVAKFLSTSELVSNPMDCNIKMTTRILTYINYSIFETQLCKTKNPRYNLEVLPSHIVNMALPLPKFAKMVMKQKKQRKIEILLVNTAFKQSTSDSTFPFATYTKAYWSDHLCNVQKDNELCQSLLKHALQKQRLALSGAPGTKTPLVRAVETDSSLFETLVTYGTFSEADAAYAIWTAANLGRHQILQIMLRSIPPTTNWRCHRLRRSPLHLATCNNDVSIVKTLLSYDKSMLNEPDVLGFTPLMYAANSGFHEIVKVLLNETGIDVEVTVSSMSQHTALELAAEEGRIITFVLLLRHFQSHALNFNSVRRALLKAAKKGYLPVVHAILEITNANKRGRKQLNKDEGLREEDIRHGLDCTEAEDIARALLTVLYEFYGINETQFKGILENALIQNYWPKARAIVHFYDDNIGSTRTQRPFKVLEDLFNDVIEWRRKTNSSKTLKNISGSLMQRQRLIDAMMSIEAPYSSFSIPFAFLELSKLLNEREEWWELRKKVSLNIGMKAFA